MNRASSGTEWARNPDGTMGYTWNPVSGCLNGCSYCYARKLAKGRLKTKYLANKNLAPWGQFAEDRRGGISPFDFGYGNPFFPRLWENKLTDDKNNPLSRKKPIGVFVCNMGDLFGIGVPKEWTRRVLEDIARCPHHRFYLLTKQSQNLAKWGKFPDNCWVGVSATDSIQYATAAYWLKAIEASVKFVSFEPLLEGIHPKAWPWQLFPEGNPKGICDWVIIGACTGSESEMRELVHKTGRMSIGNVKPFGNKWTLQPEIEWVREIVEAADRAGVAVFLKDNLRPLLFERLELPVWARTPHSLTKLRQELPEGGRDERKV